jgi:hypothetical protein
LFSLCQIPTEGNWEREREREREEERERDHKEKQLTCTMAWKSRERVDNEKMPT